MQTETTQITEAERAELAELQQRFADDEVLSRQEEDRFSRLAAKTREQPRGDLWGNRAIQDQNRQVAQQPSFDYTGDRDEN